MNEFPRLLALAMELLLVCCDDNEADVRLVAGECINKTIKVCEHNKYFSSWFFLSFYVFYYWFCSKTF